MRNLAELILERAAQRPTALLGVVEKPTTLGEAVKIASEGAGTLSGLGLTSGTRVAVIGSTSTSYLVAWITLQLAGIEAAMVNPSLPGDLIRQMLSNLDVDGVLWLGRTADTSVAPAACHLDATELDRRRLLRCAPEGDVLLSWEGHTGNESLAGVSRGEQDIAGYMHTSGTTGLPKFCAQTQSYFLRLGRFIADSMELSDEDTVFAPLPMFHINPLGYGLVGGLIGGANVLGSERFSASGFWPTIKANGVTVAFLHAPPVEILKKATTSGDARGHGIRCVFLADEEFMKQFDVPVSFSGYGSTEAGGLCHIWTWRSGDHCDHPEGMSRYAGKPRNDIEWKLSHDDEILIRGKADHVLSDGYQTADGLVPLLSEDGWFHTGDLGRRDEHDRLVFVERRTESIRVKGEFVPIPFVEGVFAEMDDLVDLALWREESDLVDHRVVLYVVAKDSLPRTELVSRADTLPSFMRPSAVVRIEAMPRLTGVGKVSRRDLGSVKVLERLEI